MRLHARLPQLATDPRAQTRTAMWHTWVEPPSRRLRGNSGRRSRRCRQAAQRRLPPFAERTCWPLYACNAADAPPGEPIQNGAWCAVRR